MLTKTVRKQKVNKRMNFRANFRIFSRFSHFYLLIMNCRQRKSKQRWIEIWIFGQNSFFSNFSSLTEKVVKTWKVQSWNWLEFRTNFSTLILTAVSQVSAQFQNSKQNIDTKSKHWKSNLQIEEKKLKMWNSRPKILIVTSRELSRTNELSFIIILI